VVGLEEALDRFCDVADDRRFGIDGVHVVLDDGRWAERRRIDDIRRDVISVSKTLTSLAIGIAKGDGLLTLDDPF
jgi:CubicO group peptidase (beta-lactamase class C family)